MAPMVEEFRKAMPCLGRHVACPGSLDENTFAVKQAGIENPL